MGKDRTPPPLGTQSLVEKHQRGMNIVFTFLDLHCAFKDPRGTYVLHFSVPTSHRNPEPREGKTSPVFSVKMKQRGRRPYICTFLTCVYPSEVQVLFWILTKLAGRSVFHVPRCAICMFMFSPLAASFGKQTHGVPTPRLWSEH